MASSQLLFKKYCKIKGKNYGPMDLDELKNLAIKGQLLPTDKVADKFPTNEWVEACSIPTLNEIFKKLAISSSSLEFNIPQDGQVNNNFQSGNINLIEKNSNEIVRLLKNISGWIDFMSWTSIIVGVVTIIELLLNGAFRLR